MQTDLSVLPPNNLALDVAISREPMTLGKCETEIIKHWESGLTI